MVVSVLRLLSSYCENDMHYHVGVYIGNRKHSSQMIDIIVTFMW